MYHSPALASVTVTMSHLVARCRWLQAPVGLLLVFLQRTPALRIATMAEGASRVVASEGMKFVFAAAAMGAYNTMAGATSFSVSPATPASGKANTTFAIDGTTGSPLTVSFTVTGAPGNPKSWSVTGTLPAGLTVTGGNPVNVSAPYKMSITGTPTAAGSSTVTVTAWDTAGAKGNKASIKCDFNIIGGITNTAPTISAQPQSLSITTGSGASFSVTATGTPTPTYQWQKGGVAIGGATGTSYSIASAQAGDAGSYSVVVSNSAGSVISNAAALTVNAAATAPTITSQPQSLTVTAGGSATFSVTATGSPSPTYQWLKGGVAIGGATSSSYSISSTQAGDAGSYSVLVTNSAGSVTSDGATLTVNAAATAPAITTQPLSLTVTEGGAATFSVTASGSPSPTYQWRKGGVSISGATSSSYAISTAQVGDTGSYSVVVTNSAGSVTSNSVTLTVNAATIAPAITTQPVAQTVTAGSGATFSVTATGTPAPTNQWRKGGVVIAGATGASFSIASTQAADAGSYTVVVTNSAGSVTSNAVTLTVNPLVTTPAITSQPQPVTVLAGSGATFSVTATGLPAPTYQWQKDSVNIVGATAANFSIANAQSGDAGLYKVIVTNSAGSITSNAVNLTITAVVTAPSITLQPQSQVITAGTTISFTVASSGTAPFTYQWQKDGSNLPGATNDTLNLPSAQVGDAGAYRVTVTNSAGTVTSNAATLTVNAATSAPVISSQPQALTVVAGSGATFSVTATGAPTPTYQWRKGGVAIGGATGSNYAISNTQVGDTGSYTVVVTNSAGSVTSNAATLTVSAATSAPAITTQPIAQSVAAGSGATFSVTATGSPTPTYQWQKGGVAISGATGANFTIATTQDSDAGSYAVVVSNSAGSITSNAVSLTVTASVVVPSIVTQPQGQTVTAGSSASFTVSAGGTAPFSYQWKKDGTNINGATASTLNFASAQSTDAGSYSVVVTNSAGTVTSSGASLTVNAAASAPTITNAPLSQTVTSGKGVSFTVTASNATAYQWEVSTNNGGSWTSVVNGSNYSGASTSQLTIVNASAGMSGYLYRTVVTGSNGSVTTGSVTLTVASAVLAGPAGVALDRSGNLLAVDSPNNDCKTVALSGSAASLAGLSGTQGADNGQGSTARFRSPVGIAVNLTNGTSYVADAGNSLIRAIRADGMVSTLAGSKDNQGYRDGVGVAAWFNAPADVAVDGNGNVYVADTGNSVIRKITADGTVTTLAGLAGQRGGDDGAGAAARFNQPAGIVVDASGVIYVADTYNHTIRRITASGVVTTFAGIQGISGYDDGSNALFNQPGGLALDSSGNLYVADAGNNTLRVISPAGVVRTLVGTPTVAGLEDGNGIHALLNQPKDVCLDSGGNVWVADYGNAAIRKVTPGGDVSTINVAMAATSVPESPATGNSNSSSGTPATPTPTPPAEVGVGGGGGGAPSNWFLLGLGLLAFIRRGFGARRR